MSKIYTAEDVIKIIKKCGNDVSKYVETYNFIKTINISEKELKKLKEYSEYAFLIALCVDVIEGGE